jgi:hypothetical protein
MAVVDCFLPANRGSGFLLLLLYNRISYILVLMSGSKWVLGIESEICPKVKLGSEIGVNLTK